MSVFWSNLALNHPDLCKRLAFEGPPAVAPGVRILRTGDVVAVKRYGEPIGTGVVVGVNARMYHIEMDVLPEGMSSRHLFAPITPMLTPSEGIELSHAGQRKVMGSVALENKYNLSKDQLSKAKKLSPKEFLKQFPDVDADTLGSLYMDLADMGVKLPKGAI